MKLGDLIYTQYYTNLQMLEGELNKKTTWLLLYLTPQPNLLDETGRLDSIRVGERLHNNIIMWTLLVLIPKCNIVTQGIELLEVVWKVVESVIDSRIKTAVRFNYVLRVFHEGRGMGTAIMEIKLAQELESM